jgi:hypothetical protein
LDKVREEATVKAGEEVNEGMVHGRVFRVYSVISVYTEITEVLPICKSLPLDPLHLRVVGAG